MRLEVSLRMEWMQRAGGGGRAMEVVIAMVVWWPGRWGVVEHVCQ